MASSAARQFDHAKDDLASVTWPHLHARTGDTLVIIDFPAADSAVSCNGHVWSNAEFLMDSQTLLGTGSSVFAHMLSVPVQQRRRRRLSRPVEQGVRYVLDLTPPTEGEESASLVADLSLPAGVRDWWMAKDRLNIAEHVVYGHDDVCPHHVRMTNCCGVTADPDETQSIKVNEFSNSHPLCDYKHVIKAGVDSIKPVPYRQIPEYCPIRHRLAIIRLLLFLRGTELVLNSAPRVWTIIGVAKALDIACIIRSPVRVWLETGFNSNLIDVHPEIALEMAWSLQLEDLARVAMRIVVVERALESGTGVLPITKFGRPRGSLSDDVENVVEHVTTAVRTRVREASSGLTSDPLRWLGISYWEDFQQLGLCLSNDLRSTEEGTADRLEITTILEHYNTIAGNLRESFRYVVLSVFGTAYSAPFENTTDNDRLAYVREDNFTSMRDILLAMNAEQSLLTRNFWAALLADTAKHDSVFNDTYLDESHMWRLNTEITRALARGILKNVNSRFPVQLPLSTEELCRNLHDAIVVTSKNWAPYAGDLEISINRTDHLALGLTEDELKFLPLWAGGLDDGTGGVYQEIPLPDADIGPSQPGPSYVTGKTIAPSTTAASDAIMVGGASVQAVRSGANTNTSATPSSFTMDSFVQVPSTESESDWDVRSLASPGSSVAPLVGEMRSLNVADGEDDIDVDVDVEVEVEVDVDDKNGNDDDVDLMDDDSSGDDTITGSWSDEWSDLYD